MLADKSFVNFQGIIDLIDTLMKTIYDDNNNALPILIGILTTFSYK